MKTLRPMRERILGNLKTLENSTTRNLTEELRQKALELITYFHKKKLPYDDDPYKLLLRRIQQWEIDFEMNFSEEHFSQNYDKYGNQQFIRWIRKILYTLAIYQDCLKRFDTKHKFKKLQAIIDGALEKYLAPLLCNDHFEHEDFILEFQHIDPVMWLGSDSWITSFEWLDEPEQKDEQGEFVNKYTPSLEASIYIDFVKALNKNKDPIEINKLYNESERAKCRNSKNRPSPIDFHECLAMFCRMHKRPRMKLLKNEAIEFDKAEAGIKQFTRTLTEKDIERIFADSPERVIMKLQSFFWEQYSEFLPLNKLEEFAKIRYEKDIKAFTEDLKNVRGPWRYTKVLRDKIQANFTNQANVIASHKNDIFSMLKYMVGLLKQNSYTYYYNFEPGITGILNYIMDFWMLYKHKIALSQLVDIYQAIPVRFAVHQEFGEFLLHCFDPTQYETHDNIEYQKCLVTEILCKNEVFSGKVNTNITEFLKKMALRGFSTHCDLTVTYTITPRDITFARNRYLEKKHPKNISDLVLLDHKDLFNDVTERLQTTSFWFKLRHPKFQRNAAKLVQDINNISDQNLDDVIVMLDYLKLLYKKQSRFFSPARNRLQNLINRVLKTLADTTLMEKCELPQLLTMLNNLPLESTHSKVIVDSLWLKLGDLQSGDQYKLFVAVLKHPKACFKYQDRIKQLYLILNRSYEHKLQEEDKKAFHSLYNGFVRSSTSGIFKNLKMWIKSKLLYNDQTKPSKEFAVEKISDKALKKFIETAPNEQIAAFQKNASTLINPSNDEQKYSDCHRAKTELCEHYGSQMYLLAQYKNFYYFLRRELTHYLALQQYILEKQLCIQRDYMPANGIRLEDVSNTPTVTPNKAWIACLYTFSNEDLFHLKPLVENQPYHKASILAELFARKMTLQLKPLLHRIEFSDRDGSEINYDLESLAYYCFQSITVTKVQLPNTKSDTFNLDQWALHTVNSIRDSQSVFQSDIHEKNRECWGSSYNKSVKIVYSKDEILEIPIPEILKTTHPIYSKNKDFHPSTLHQQIVSNGTPPPSAFMRSYSQVFPKNYTLFQRSMSPSDAAGSNHKKTASVDLRHSSATLRPF